MQSRLQIGPDGLASTWNPGGAVGGRSAGQRGRAAPVAQHHRDVDHAGMLRALRPQIEGEPRVALGRRPEEREDHRLGAVRDEAGDSGPRARPRATRTRRRRRRARLRASSHSDRAVPTTCTVMSALGPYQSCSIGEPHPLGDRARHHVAERDERQRVDGAVRRAAASRRSAGTSCARCRSARSAPTAGARRPACPRGGASTAGTDHGRTRTRCRPGAGRGTTAASRPAGTPGVVRSVNSKPGAARRTRRSR